MVAEIKAKLELISGGMPALGGGPIGSSGGGGGGSHKENNDFKMFSNKFDAFMRLMDRRLESFGSISDSMKDILTIFRKPGFSAGKGGTGLLGEAAAAVGTAVSGTAAAAVAGAVTIGSIIYLGGIAIGEGLVGMNKNKIENVPLTPEAKAQITELVEGLNKGKGWSAPAGGVSGESEYLDLMQRYAIDYTGGAQMTPEFDSATGRLRDIKDVSEDIVAVGEQYLTTLNEQGTNSEVVLQNHELTLKLLEQMQASGMDVTDAINAEKAAIEGVNQKLDEQISKQKQLNELQISRIRKSGKTASGDDEYEAQVGEYTYTGKVNVGNLQGKFIGVRTVR